MKKFGILLLSLCLTTPALADFWTNCTNNGGTIVTANSYGNDKGGLCNDPSDSSKTNNCNGKRFCMSGLGMNWWSSFTWCEAIGGHLASFTSMCPGTQALPDKDRTGACANLTKVLSGNSSALWAWSSLGWGKTAVLEAGLTSGTVYNHWERHSGSYRAFCEE